MPQVFDPYSRWLGIPTSDHPPDHYALLGLAPFEQGPELIREAAERQAARLRPHRQGEHAELSTRILHDLSAALDCLLDPRQKAEYDDRLQRAGRMDDTRPMNDAGLDLRQDGPHAGSGPWTVAEDEDSKPSAAAMAGHDRGPVEAERTGDSTDSTGSAARSSSSWGSFESDPAVAEAVPAGHRRPLLAVVLGASALGMILVAVLAVVAALTATRSPAPSDGNRPVGPAVSGAASPSERGGGEAAADNRTPADPAGMSARIDPATSPASAAGDPALSVAVPGDGSSAEPGDESASPSGPGEPPAQNEEDSGPPPPRRLPLPTVEQRERGLAEIAAKHGLDRPGTRREKLDLAERLVEEADDAAAPPPMQLALLWTATRLAGEAGDPVLALTGIERIEAKFEIDEAEVERLLAETLGPHVETGRQAWQRYLTALETLAVAPDDPVANLTLGEYYCFVREDWQRGLPYLARGENTALRLVAEKELSGVGSWQQRLELGDSWWAISLLADPDRQAIEQEQAARWYRLALPDLEGAEKRRAQSRLASLISVPEPETEPETGSDLLESPPEPVPLTPDDGDRAGPSPGEAQPVDLTGTWRSDRMGSVFRLVDRGGTVRCELVSSKTVKSVDGLWIRDDDQLICDRWRFGFVEDPNTRVWDLGCEPTVLDGKTIRLRAEVVRWDRFGREVDREWESAEWRRVE